MSEIFTFLAGPAIVGFIFFLIIRHIKKGNANPKRLPQRAEDLYPTHRSVASGSRSPSPAVAVARMPRRADDREYMNYRNCPDCHSENQINRQVIFKLAPHQFVCTVCGHRFNF